MSPGIEDRPDIIDENHEPISFAYNHAADIFTIGGIHYAGNFFRMMGSATIGQCFQIISMEDGTISLRELPPEAAQFLKRD